MAPAYRVCAKIIQKKTTKENKRPKQRRSIRLAKKSKALKWPLKQAKSQSQFVAKLNSHAFGWTFLPKYHINYDLIKMSNLMHIKYIGAGSFGKVSAVRYRNQYFALKSVCKSLVESNDCISAVQKERKILFEARECPFIVELHRTYRTERNVLFLMELCMGGDVYTYSRSFVGNRMPEANAKFIIACVSEALKFLHARYYVFRDLKANNIIINAFGWCKLTDFGFCEPLAPGKTLCEVVGTASHFAPEQAKFSQYDHAVDLWALGITLYSILTRRLPFRGNDLRNSLRKEILAGFLCFVFPKYLSMEVRDFIKALCRKEPKKRLGYKSLCEFEQSPWLRQFNWKGLQDLSMKSPIKRIFHSKTDLRYFCPDKETLNEHILDDEIEDPPINDSNGWDVDF